MSYLITCPICGKRNLYEFRFGGEDQGPRPAEEDLTPEEYYAFVHLQNNHPGPRAEWWYHRDGCGSWIRVWRDPMTNRETAPPEDKP